MAGTYNAISRSIILKMAFVTAGCAMPLMQDESSRRDLRFL